MKTERNNGYSGTPMTYQGMQPMYPNAPMMPGMGAPMMPQPMPGMGMPMMPGYMDGMQGMNMQGTNQLENRIAVLERQMRKMDARLSKLETPYGQTTSQYQPGSYTQGDESANYPYQTSMQMM